MMDKSITSDTDGNKNLATYVPGQFKNYGLYIIVDIALTLKASEWLLQTIFPYPILATKDTVQKMYEDGSLNFVQKNLYFIYKNY